MVLRYWLKCFKGLGNLEARLNQIPMVEKCLLRILGVSLRFLFISFSCGTFDCRNHFVHDYSSCD